MYLLRSYFLLFLLLKGTSTQEMWKPNLQPSNQKSTVLWIKSFCLEPHTKTRLNGVENTQKYLVKFTVLH